MGVFSAGAFLASVAFSVVALDRAAACGPGRNSRRYRSPEPQTPMVLRQHEPQTMENSPFASGRSLGRISRDDPRFSKLIPVYDDNIIIQDAEGTGHDRMMTENRMRPPRALAAAGWGERETLADQLRSRQLGNRQVHRQVSLNWFRRVRLEGENITSDGSKES
ncbi:hypothetical protein GE061_017649 [Apolygus lucorum]|uniref:Hedgehog N-terminal signalling domain-containing protein n=1 Tax=Apolygus lucorum TaxID=248454 RepID=A0A8S9XE90_APOLU|nr:hypothetical protein GE061_017649 [Apolygus lucorum]